LRKRRRSGVGCSRAAAQHARASAVVRPHRAVQRQGSAAGSGSQLTDAGPVPGAADQGAGLHHLQLLQSPGCVHRRHESVDAGRTHQVSRGHHARPGKCAAGVHGPVQRQQLRQAAGAGGGLAHRASMSRAQKISLLIALYFAQGLPFGFFTIALPAMLRQSGQSLKTISLVSVLLTLPWLLNFLWAPFVDHRGTRRGWLLTLQLSSLAVALAITHLHFDGIYVLLFAAAFTFNLIAATQDIANDAVAVRMLDARELGLANGIQVGAYRVGMMFGGGLVIKVFELSGWSLAFGCMAALLATNILPALLMREAKRVAAGA